MQMLQTELEGDAEGFREAFGQEVLGWLEVWRRGKETEIYRTVTFAKTPIIIKTMFWNHFSSFLFYLFLVFYHSFKKLNITFIKLKRRIFPIPQPG